MKQQSFEASPNQGCVLRCVLIRHDILFTSYLPAIREIWPRLQLGRIRFVFHVYWFTFEMYTCSLLSSMSAAEVTRNSL